MHDDQHGTAIISAAALLNAVELQEKKLSEIKVVVIGAGASAIACANHYVAIGVTRSNIAMVDSKGIVTKARLEAGELNEYKAPFAHEREAGDLADALNGADVCSAFHEVGANEMCSCVRAGKQMEFEKPALRLPRYIINLGILTLLYHWRIE